MNEGLCFLAGLYAFFPIRSRRCFDRRRGDITLRQCLSQGLCQRYGLGVDDISKEFREMRTPDNASLGGFVESGSRGENILLRSGS